jgi:hypothetical protein
MVTGKGDNLNNSWHLGQSGGGGGKSMRWWQYAYMVHRGRDECWTCVTLVTIRINDVGCWGVCVNEQHATVHGCMHACIHGNGDYTVATIPIHVECCNT